MSIISRVFICRASYGKVVVVVTAAAQTVVMLAVFWAKKLNLGRQENVFVLIYVSQVQNAGPVGPVTLVGFGISSTVTMANAKKPVLRVVASALPETQIILLMAIIPTVFLLIILVDV